MKIKLTAAQRKAGIDLRDVVGPLTGRPDPSADLPVPRFDVTLSDLDLGVKPGEFHFICPYADGYTRVADFPSPNGWRTAWEIHVAVNQYLWVRETWRIVDGRHVFRADADDEDEARSKHVWKPGIHLLRSASRLVLEVRHVRLERLHHLSEQDAKDEGVRPLLETYPSFAADQEIDGDRVDVKPYRTAYVCLWDEINGKRALWNSNPFVWVIEFKVHRISP